jgi:hypothetical protein
MSPISSRKRMLEDAGTAAVGTREGALLVTEEFGLDQGLG